ncbi:MAG: hypothetical protein WAU61_15745, partial [Smithella sp.]
FKAGKLRVKSEGRGGHKRFVRLVIASRLWDGAAIPTLSFPSSDAVWVRRRESSVAWWNKHNGSAIIETCGGCAWASLHPPCGIAMNTCKHP